jgi:hypothetical protein
LAQGPEFQDPVTNFTRFVVLNTTNTVASFEQCVFTLKRSGFNIEEAPAALSLLVNFEQKYQCSGFANIPLFYYSQNLSYGVPNVTCWSPLKT